MEISRPSEHGTSSWRGIFKPPNLMSPPPVQALAELAAIQDESIVSRVLLKASGGSVTVFAFAQGEGLREHSTPREALLVVTEGKAEVSIAGTMQPVEAGEAVHLPASIPHAVHAPVDVRVLLVTLQS